MTHSAWIDNNYKFLRKWSKIWANDNWSDLLSHYVEYLDTNWRKFEDIPNDDERIKFTQTWMKNQTRWTNSDFNRLHRINNLGEEWTIPDESEDQFLELRCESDREDINLWLIDIHSHFGDEGANKLIRIREAYLRLETPEKVLYDLYFSNMNTMREISDKLDIPLTAVFKMIAELKNKLEICSR